MSRFPSFEQGYDDTRARLEADREAEHRQAVAEAEVERAWGDRPAKPDPKPPLKRCEVCGAEIRNSRYRVRRTCSMECYRKSSIPHEKQLRGQKRRAEANPNFAHGRRVGENIRGWSPADKGETCCRQCGSPHYLQLHHAIPRSKARSERRDLRNGLPLCASCHQRWHKGARELHRDLFTDAEWAYLRSVTLLGENTDAWLASHYPERLVEF